MIKTPHEGKHISNSKIPPIFYIHLLECQSTTSPLMSDQNHHRTSYKPKLTIKFNFTNSCVITWVSEWTLVSPMENDHQCFNTSINIKITNWEEKLHHTLPITSDLWLEKSFKLTTNLMICSQHHFNIRKHQFPIICNRNIPIISFVSRKSLTSGDLLSLKVRKIHKKGGFNRVCQKFISLMILELQNLNHVQSLISEQVTTPKIKWSEVNARNTQRLSWFLSSTESSPVPLP